jgi:hypothetical protein
VRDLQPGVWHWEAPHPDWSPSEPWHQNVSSYAIDDGERLPLFDPLAPPPQLDELAAGRELLERPFELVLPTHGAPTDRAALEHALA